MGSGTGMVKWQNRPERQLDAGNVAMVQPPHLAAIAPWEGASEIYRDCFAAGGIPETLFTNGVFSNLYSDTWIEDPVAMIEKYPLMNDYWASKIPALGNITVPAYIVASWTNLLHTKGTFNGWNKIASQEKWLRVHDRHEWVDYYDPQNVEDLRRFFRSLSQRCGQRLAGHTESPA